MTSRNEDSKSKKKSWVKTFASKVKSVVVEPESPPREPQSKYSNFIIKFDTDNRRWVKSVGKILASVEDVKESRSSAKTGHLRVSAKLDPNTMLKVFTQEKAIVEHWNYGDSPSDLHGPTISEFLGRNEDEDEAIEDPPELNDMANQNVRAGAYNGRHDPYGAHYGNAYNPHGTHYNPHDAHYGEPHDAHYGGPYNHHAQYNPHDAHYGGPYNHHAHYNPHDAHYGGPSNHHAQYNPHDAYGGSSYGGSYDARHGGSYDAPHDAYGGSSYGGSSYGGSYNAYDGSYDAYGGSYPLYGTRQHHQYHR